MSSDSAGSSPTDKVSADRALLAEAVAAGGWQKYKAYIGLSGPGWIASAITLGGGSLASSLYLGVIGGYSMLWVQVLAMMMGVVMLGAIGYVTLSSGERPFSAINNHVSPVLGWAWALAVAAANIIWCMPQHSLAFGVISQNFAPEGVFGQGGSLVTWATESLGESVPTIAANFDRLVVSAMIFAVALIVTWSYDRGGLGLRIYETCLKIVVGLIVLAFMGVVATLLFSEEGLPIGEIAAGFIPNFSRFFNPADTWLPYLDSIGAAGTPARTFWQETIVGIQRDVLISAAATAVGINMTLMFPYSMLRKGWTREFRGLAVFDLWTGMFIPFLLATSCVVIAAGARFHTETPAGFETETVNGLNVLTSVDEDGPKFGAYSKLLAAREAALQPGSDNEESIGAPALADEERLIAAMLVKRDAFDLAAALEPLTGRRVANWVFGFGVLAMVLSTISVLMLISGFVYAEMLGYQPGGFAHKFGTLIAGIGGAMWPFFWTGDSQFYLAIVASVFGFMLLPFAYVTFVFLLNSKNLLGDDLPRGMNRLLWNVPAIAAAIIVTIAAAYMVWVKAKWFGVVAIFLFVKLVVLVHFHQKNQAKSAGGTA